MQARVVRDYGVRSDRAGPPLGRASLVGLALIALAMSHAELDRQKQQKQAAIAEAWTLLAPGPPCPTVARLTDIGFTPALRTVQFDDVHFGRAYSYMTCGDIGDNGGRGPGSVSVCQFNDPMVVEVTTPKSHVIFFTRTRPATISVDHGLARCVLNPSRGIY
jgi:hypothetical protein